MKLRKAFCLLLLLLMLPMSMAHAAVFPVTDGAQLLSAIASAADGDTIQLNGTLADIGTVDVAKNLTFTGGTVTGNSSFRVEGTKDVTFTGVTFSDIHNPSNTLSAIYAPGLAGSLTVTDCAFDDIDWDAIQATPVDGAQLTITGNTFRDDDPAVRQQRYVHIQSAPDTDFSATVTDNRMFGDPAQEALGVYYPADPAKQQLTRNFFADTITYPVCILNGAGENIAQIAYPQIDENGQPRVDQAVLGKSEFYATAYPSLEAAAAAGESDLVLLDNTALTQNIALPDGSTLDLNGYTLTTAPGVSLPDNVTVIENGGSVTSAAQPGAWWWLLLLLPFLLFLFMRERQR